MTDTQEVDAIQNQAEVVVPEPAEPAPVAEKMIPQSQVNEIVKARMADAADKARRAAFEEAHRQQTLEALPAHDEDKQRALIAEEIERRVQAEIQNKAALQVQGKIEDAIRNYPDFEEKVARLDLENSPHIVWWANELDNTAAVLYELGQNPSKFANVIALAAVAPKAARDELQRISKSITQNQSVTKPSVKEPLSQITPSVTATDNGELTAQDWKKMDWLKA